jgi:hypothetical protein
MIERNAETSRDVLLFALARGANIDGQQRLTRRQQFRGKRRTEAFREGDQFGPRSDSL